MARSYKKNGTERGNALFVILICVALLAGLSWYMTRTNRGGVNQTGTAQMDSQIQMLFAQGSILAGAIQQMIANGADPNAIFGTTATTGLNTVIPSGAPPAGFATWDAAPHNWKIYHPYGGGVKYMNQTGTGAALDDKNNLANNFLISKGSIVVGVGPTDVAGDILFTAVVSSAAACARINTLLTGSSTLGVVSDAAYTALFTSGTNTTLSAGAGTCTSGCNNVARLCVRNTSSNAWGYYQVLLPQ